MAQKVCNEELKLVGAKNTNELWNSLVLKAMGSWNSLESNTLELETPSVIRMRELRLLGVKSTELVLGLPANGELELHRLRGATP